jgi:uncharacterized protein HemX
MMYGNSYNPTPSAAKAIVVFLSLILIGTVALVLLASGNLGPKADAQAKQIESQTKLNEAEKSLALKFQEALYQQQLEQAARDFELGQALKDWGTRALIIGLMLTTVIIAAGKSVQWVYQARQVTQVTSAGQVQVEPSGAASEALRMRNIYALFEQMNDRIEHLERQVATLRAQLLAAQQQLERLQTHGGNGSDPGEKIIPFKNAMG